MASQLLRGLLSDGRAHSRMVQGLPEMPLRVHACLQFWVAREGETRATVIVLPKCFKISVYWENWDTTSNVCFKVYKPIF
jgi:hypothetical protein